jgi:hypothetical protein
MPADPEPYKRCMERFMAYIDGCPRYPKGHVFPQERLAQITPDDIMRWFNHLTYGTEDPDPDQDPHARSTDLKNKKKMLSYFMPNNHHPWNEITDSGNPTRAKVILNLIKRVKKKETRHQGVPSQARRPLKESEYRSAIILARASNDHLVRYGLPALMALQLALIARVDDATQWKKDHFKAHSSFPTFAAQARLNWSKNVNEERDAPWQILIGSMDPHFCVLLNVGLWLEVHLQQQPGASLSPYVLSFSNNNEVPEGGKRAKDTSMNNMRNIFNHPDFDLDAAAGPLGTHSVRKFASTRARRMGASKDEKDSRGRWKKARVSDVYDDVELPYPDAKVAGLLCVGGACSYRIKEGANITDDWIRSHVVPRISSVYDADLAVILGKAILWLCFSEYNMHVPEIIRNHVMQSYEAVRQLNEGENPVEKRTLIITGFDAVVQIVEADIEISAEVAQEAGIDVQNIDGMTSRQLLHTLMAQLSVIQREITNLNQHRENDRATHDRQVQVLNQNIRRLAMNPIRQINQQQQQAPGDPVAQAGAPPVGPPADLSATPRTLYELWEEYQNGTGGRKAARLFTAQERGRVKHKYCRRKVIWDVVAARIRAGDTAQVACDRIYIAYGHATPVTTIINRIKHDKQQNNLPQELTV